GGAAPGGGAGVSLRVAAHLVASLGVTNAVNLDGGGSSTFVSHGQVLNHPSDGVARAVANAWVAVTSDARRSAPERPKAHRHGRAAAPRTRTTRPPRVRAARRVPAT